METSQHLTASYRPISLLSTISKVLERIILTRMQLHLDENNIIPDHQFGFRAGLSTTHQVDRIVKAVRSGFQRKESTGLVMLDLSSAFDNVWHHALIYKMVKAHFPKYLTKLVLSYLTDRTFRVKVGRELSSTKELPAGVPQGGVLSPTLFNIYVADIPTSQGVQTAQFADDIALWHSKKNAPSIRKALQDATLKLSKYVRRWKLQLNASKTEAIFFTRRRHPRAFPRQPIRIQGHETVWRDNAKYLGVCLDQKTTFKKHVDYVLEKGNKCTRLLYPLLCRKSKLHQENKLLIFKTVLRPAILYASPAWVTCSASQLSRVQGLQNRCLKMALSLHHRFPTDALHELAGVKTVKDYTAESHERFELRSRLLDNQLLAHVYN